MSHIPRALVLSLLVFGAGCEADWEPTPGGFGGGGENPGTSPVLSLASPFDGQVLGVGQSLSIEGTVTDEDHALNQQTVTLTSSLSGEIPLDLTLMGGDTFVATTDLELGEHLLTFTVTDPRDNSTEAEVTVSQVDDQPPSAPEVVIHPQEPVSGQGLFVGILTESVDPEGASITYDYSWTLNGEARPEWSGFEEIPQGVISLGDEWTAQVRATDGAVYSDIGEDSVSVDGGGPAITVEISPERATATSALTCSWEAIDYDGQEITEEKAIWYVDGTEVADGALILTPDNFTVDNVVACEVTATSSQTNTANDQVTIENSPPELTDFGIDPAEVYEDTVATCIAEAEDPDGDEITLRYVWISDGTVLLEDSKTIDGTYFDKGDQITCRILASDAFEETTTNTLAKTVLNSPPSIPGVQISPEAPSIGQTLTCSPTATITDADPSDTVNVRYAWAVNGTTDSSATTTTYDTTGVADGSTIECEITAADGMDTTTASATVYMGDRLEGTYNAAKADVYIKGRVAQGYFGHSIAAPGDVDGDGTADLVVSGVGYESDAGAIFLYDGATLGAGGIFQDEDAAYYWYGGTAGDGLGDGQGVAAAGDVDGDGSPDILAAASLAAGDGGTERGEVYLLGTDGSSWTSGGDVTDEASIIFRGDTDKDRFGEGLLGTDLDGDGLSDVAIGAPYEDTGANAAGMVAVFYGSSLSSGSTYDASDADVLLYGSGSADRLGLNAVRAIGDVDGDGTDDVLLGAYNADTSTETDAGVAYIIASSALSDGPAEDIATVTIEGESEGDNFGLSAVGLGDLDSDGQDDFAVGARFADVSTTDAGGVYFFYGDGTWSGTFDASSADASWGGDEEDGRLGWDMAAADMDGDGSLELTTGAYSTSNGSLSFAGDAFLLLGSGASSWSTGGYIGDTAQASFIGNASNHYVGRKPAIVGDMDGNGSGEWVVGGEGIARGSDNRVGFVYMLWGP